MIFDNGFMIFDNGFVICVAPAQQKKELSPLAVGIALSGYGIYPAHALIIPYPSMINN